MTLPIPDGWYEVPADDVILRGDQWCVRNRATDLEYLDAWLPARWFGTSIAEMKNNVYIRKVSDSQPDDASLSVPQDSQSTS